jgi:glycosyltransferase involved in cell wall biosynthesis
LKNQLVSNSYKATDPHFSVIVNCRNSEKYLRDCLESIQNQTFSDFEVVIWNNMSTDDTAKIVNEFEQADHRFLLYSGNHSLNLGEARNCAVKKSSGRYLAFLDSDDLWDRNFLQQHYLALDKFGEDSFGNGNILEISEDFDISMMSEYSTRIFDSTQPKPIFQKLLKGNSIYFSSLVMPRNFFINEAGFRNDYVQAEDYELILRLAKKFSCYKTGLAYYRIHPGNATNNQEESLYRESIEILKPYIKWLPARMNRLGTIGKYYQFLAPLKPAARNDRISTTGVSVFEIALAITYNLFFDYFRALIPKGKR